VYTIANGRFKVANKNFSPCSSDYEVAFGNDADIRLSTSLLKFEVFPPFGEGQICFRSEIAQWLLLARMKSNIDDHLVTY
jgi:hypothetical protein